MRLSAGIDIYSSGKKTLPFPTLAKTVGLVTQAVMGKPVSTPRLQLAFTST